MAGLAFACRLLHSSSITQMLTLLSLQESILLKIQRQRRWVAERARRQEIFGINFLHGTCVWKQRSYSMVHFSVLTCLKHQAWVIYQRKNIFFKKLPDVKWYVFRVWNNVVVSSEETKYPSFWNRAYNHIALIKTCTLFIQVIDLLNQAQLEKENKLNCLKQVWLNLVCFTSKEINMHCQTMSLLYCQIKKIWVFVSLLFVYFDFSLNSKVLIVALNKHVTSDEQILAGAQITK